MSTKDEIKGLMKQKESIEREIKELADLLDSQKGVGLHESLVDLEGFPRSDVDVYSVRHSRQRLICLQNDHKELMSRIEQMLHRLHAESRGSSQGAEAMETTESQSNVNWAQAFVRVDSVETGSPADQGGLAVHDLVVQFGSVTKSNFVDLQTVGRVVQHSRGKAVPLEVIRNSRLVQLSITPQTWSGRGLLGCNIVPMTRGS